MQDLYIFFYRMNIYIDRFYNAGMKVTIGTGDYHNHMGDNIPLDQMVNP